MCKLMGHSWTFYCEVEGRKESTDHALKSQVKNYFCLATAQHPLPWKNDLQDLF